MSHAPDVDHRHRTSSRGRGRRPRGGRSKRPQKSVADLDAEMEDMDDEGNMTVATAESDEMDGEEQE